jgi:hypothetical protein
VRKKTLPLIVIATLWSLLTAAEARAWIGQGFGYSTPGPNGEYNAGGRVGRYGGLYYGGGGYNYNNYSGAYRSAFGYGRISGLGTAGAVAYTSGDATSDNRPDVGEPDSGVVIAAYGRR